MDKKMQRSDGEFRQSQPEPLSTIARQWFHGWVERHIVADDPYDDPDVEPPAREKSGPGDVSLVLALFVVSGALSIIGLISLWRALAG
jgi:hypothetical protein